MLNHIKVKMSMATLSHDVRSIWIIQKYPLAENKEKNLTQNIKDTILLLLLGLTLFSFINMTD